MGAAVANMPHSFYCFCISQLFVLLLLNSEVKSLVLFLIPFRVDPQRILDRTDKTILQKQTVSATSTKDATAGVYLSEG